MPMNPSPISTRLSEDEYEDLADVLDEHSPLDIEAVLGLLNAVAAAPGMVPPSTWIPVVLPEGMGSLGKTEAEGLLLCLMRLYNEVVGTLSDGAAMYPEADDVEACESFAKGYLVGAQLDAGWVDDDDRWTFASWAAYLAGRRDHVTPRHLKEFDKNPDEARAMLRREIGAQLRAAYETFRDRARAASLEAKGRGSSPATKVGRNEPCPCGSGKKFKRCCAGVGTKVN